MLTVLLAWMHSRSINPNFAPDFLYLGTVIVDITLIIEIASMF